MTITAIEIEEIIITIINLKTKAIRTRISSSAKSVVVTSALPTLKGRL